MKNKYVIYTTQRTGSTWLVDMLNNNHNVSAYSELFRLNVDKDFPSYGEKDIKLFHRWKLKKNFIFNVFRKKKQVNEYFEELLSVNEHKKHESTLGCKIMYNQVNNNHVLLRASLIFFNQFIHLKRRDHLRVAISHAVMENTGISHSKNEIDFKPVEVDISNIVYYMKNIKKEEKRMDLF